MKKVYIVGIGGIGISAIARYYNELNYNVMGSDLVKSSLISRLQSEGIDVIIGEDPERVTDDTEFLIYSNSIPENQLEIEKAKELGIKTFSYPEALAEITKDYKLIAISGSHGKSTTSSMIAIMIKNSLNGVNAVIGSILKEFDNKNCFYSSNEYFVIEACEYKRAFLNYKPLIGIITNIDLDHMDYYKDLSDYESAFKSFIDNIQPGGVAILNAECLSSQKLIGLRKDINYINIFPNRYEISRANSIKSFFTKSILADINGNSKLFPELNLKIPGEHILFDSRIAFVVGKVLGLSNFDIKNSLEKYNGIWRRSEIIGTTHNGNLLMSDYGHHPTEIKATLKGLKARYSDQKLFVAFQPHQYARTLSLLEDFKTCFEDADILIVPNIYESRDSEEDKAKIDSAKFIEVIDHPNKYNGNGLENTLQSILNYDAKFPNSSVILLLGAGDIDNLRYKIEVG